MITSPQSTNSSTFHTYTLYIQRNFPLILIYTLAKVQRRMPMKTSPTCPFCAIATAHPPLPPSSALQTVSQQQDNSYPGDSQKSHAFLVLSTKYVLAFLDIMPLSKGHILVVTREHYEKVGELGVRIGEEVCLLSLHLLNITWTDEASL